MKEKLRALECLKRLTKQKLVFNCSIFIIHDFSVLRQVKIFKFSNLLTPWESRYFTAFQECLLVIFIAF